MRKEKIFRILSVTAFFLLLAAGIGSAAYAAGPDISGNWNSTIGAHYVIIQTGAGFQWQVPKTGELGFGNITGNTCSAVWPFGHATGNITSDPSGWATKIVWSNGVIFTRGPGGGPGPGPAPGDDVAFSFGPNPARPGAEVWLDLNKNVGNQIQVFLNGMLLPIVNTKGQSYVIVKLPLKVTPGPIEIEYQGRRIQSNQPKKVLDIIPVDVSGNWRNQGQGFEYKVNQNHGTYNVTWVNPVGLIIIGTDKGNGNVYDGDKLNVHWGAKPPSMNLNDVGTITDVDPNGRAHRIQWNSGDVWMRP
ncbi:MAG: hypothetical protein JW765_07715 [Deltaproteobacteria bacterium]|nr:hypothetical protein [Candidatus Zymogenaceae bacterium]